MDDEIFLYTTDQTRALDELGLSIYADFSSPKRDDIILKLLTEVVWLRKELNSLKMSV